MRSRRVMAVVALVLFAAAAALVAVSTVRGFPRGLIAALLVLLAFVAGWEAIRRRGLARTVMAVIAVLLLIGAVVAIAMGGILAEVIVLAVILVLASLASREAFRIHVQLPTADPPKHPVVIWNPKSGGGKAAAAHLDDEARARGIEPIQLSPGDDLFQLARDAVERGADALAAAGGDGTQAIIATIAAELDLPFACIPAGTRNHFALDLGVDRNDVVGALDAFVSGGERRVDLAEVNGRIFVNNVSLGLYAESVQREGYRDAKLHTVLETVPEFGGPQASSATDLRFDRPGDGPAGKAIVVMVSNNNYRLGNLIGSGTRPRDRRRTSRPGGVGGSCRWTPPPAAPVGRSDVRGRLRRSGAGRRRRRGDGDRSATALHHQAGRAACSDRPASSGCVAGSGAAQQLLGRDPPLVRHRPPRLTPGRTAFPHSDERTDRGLVDSLTATGGIAGGVWSGRARKGT